MSDQHELIKDFLIESNENLDRLDQDFVALEKDPSDRQRLASIFRTIHTIKGTCGFFGFRKLEEVTHIGENVLSRLRDGTMRLDPDITNALLKMVDAVREMLTSIEQDGQEGTGDYSQVIQTLMHLRRRSSLGGKPVLPTDARGGLETSPAAPTPPPKKPPIPPPEPPPAPAENGDPAPQKSRKREQLGKILLRLGRLGPEMLLQALQEQQRGQGVKLGDLLIRKGLITQRDLEEALRVQNDQGRGTGVADNSVRVDVGLLDQLMDLVGELVLARNNLLQHTTGQGDTGLQHASQRLNLITTSLQERVMRTRMQAVGNVFNKFPRTVRDLAVTCGKRIRLEMEGQETELDKTLLEAIKDPLTHIIRNAVDHGIEPPEVREQRGKPAEGVLNLRAYHEGGHVIIELTDDGGGINLERVRAKALERNLINHEQAPRLSEQDVLGLIFLPGFSTADKVTSVSGRGVGMDVVKTNIEKLGGSVDIRSTLGQGTTLRIKIPLTLAIIPALIVITGGDRYAIPQSGLVELVRLRGSQAREEVELIHGTPVYRLRGQLLPLVYLHRLLEVEPRAELTPPVTRHSLKKARRAEVKPATERLRKRALEDMVNIVVLQANGRPFGLVVDRINDTEEIVVKPLSGQLKGLPLYAGATIMGDGRVALILDVLGLARRAGLRSDGRQALLAGSEGSSQEEECERQTLLIVQASQERRLAIPLSRVTRLETFPRNAVERTGMDEVVKYRGGIMRLIQLESAIGIPSEAAPGGKRPLHVVVHSERGRTIGLVVHRILDILHVPLRLETQRLRPGVLGSAVLQERVMEVIDVPGVVDLFHPLLECAAS